jgi:enoyl-CoA hydratase
LSRISTVDRAGGIRVISLDRPEARNALSSDMKADLVDALADADQDASVKAVVLTGSDPAFCAGNDFTDLEQFADRYGNQFRVDVPRALRAMTTPVICAVNGPCVSGGLEVALSATFVIASTRARFADTHARLDVLPTWGLSALLPRAVGYRFAKEMSITGRFVDPDEALRVGLVNRVVEHASLVETAIDLASSVLETSAVSEILRIYARGEDLSFASALSHETATAYARPLDKESFSARGREATESTKE